MISPANYTDFELKRAAQQAAKRARPESDVPAWARYPRIRLPEDGLVHRVTTTYAIGLPVHDEMSLAYEDVTGCGVPIAPTEDPERAGFGRDDVALTCMTCASERSGEGDALRQLRKTLVFGASYGMTGARMLWAAGRPALHRAWAQCQQYTRVGMGYTLPSPRRNRAAFMHQFARLVLPP